MNKKYWKDFIALGVFIGLLTGLSMFMMGIFIKSFIILIMAFIASWLVRYGLNLKSTK